MRGRRIESMELISPAGRRTLASWNVDIHDSREAQSVYQVAPGGDYLALLTGGELKLFDAAGKSRRAGREVTLFRFAPSGSSLAMVAGGQVEVIDLATWAHRRLGSAPGAVLMEWVAGGVVIRGGHHAITYYPLDGTPHLVATEAAHVERLMGASHGTRVAWFTMSGLFLADVADSSQPRQLTGGVESLITAEMAPDGSHVVYAANSLHQVDADGTNRRLSPGMMFSLWFSPDGGELAYSWGANAAIRQGETARTFMKRGVPNHDIESVRFRRDASGMLVLRGRDVLSWDPDSGRHQLLARVAGESDAKVLDADVFRAGVVAWISRPDPTDPPRHL